MFPTFDNRWKVIVSSFLVSIDMKETIRRVRYSFFNQNLIIDTTSSISWITRGKPKRIISARNISLHYPVAEENSILSIQNRSYIEDLSLQHTFELIRVRADLKYFINTLVYTVAEYFLVLCFLVVHEEKCSASSLSV